jgi:formylglycine-generating enzyme required for sulfatase activity
MVVIPAGSFMMGARRPQFASDQSELPQHQVTIQEPFAMGADAVTFDEWDACIAGGGCGGYKPADNGWGRGDRPVINVSWDDAKAYAAWLSDKTGQTYRLPSEAEFEYAARAGTETEFWWGASLTTDRANYNGKPVYRQQTLPVKSFEPNPWGLYQVHGNVDEWMEDCSNHNYKGAPADGSANTGGDCSKHIIRGGSWASTGTNLRAAYRIWIAAGKRNPYRGFRLVRPL